MSEKEATARIKINKMLGGTVFFNDRNGIDKGISEMMLEVDKIQQHMQQIIIEIYGRFLIDSANIDEREYSDPVDQIREVLIHGNYMSQKDINICFPFDLGTIADNPEIINIRELHDVLSAKSF